MIINDAQIERDRVYGDSNIQVHVRDDQMRHFVLTFTSPARFELFVNRLRKQLYELKADVPNAELKEKETS